MSGTEGVSSGIKINPALVLSGADLIKEAESMPVEEFDLGNGMTLQRQGIMFKFTGNQSLLSGGAMIAALQSMDMGGDAGQAMFNTYRKTHPEDFDGSRSMDAILARAKSDGSPFATAPAPESQAHDQAHIVEDGGTYNASESEEGVHVRAGDKTKITGSAEDDFLEAVGRARVWGGGGNDDIRVEGESWVDGGDGDDRISAGENATIEGGTGDNYISAYTRATVTAGDGNDWIEAYEKSSIRAGDGDNFVSTYNQSTVTTGQGSDSIRAGTDSVVVSGAGDDTIKVGKRGVVEAGTGNDQITVEEETIIRFNRGDGQDIIAGGKRGYAFSETNRLSSSTIAFGEGISASDLDFQAQGNDLLVRIQGSEDSLTIADYQRHGVPSFTFNDGSAITSADVTAAVGPGEAYKPASQVLQRWHDANTAYQSAQVNAQNSVPTEQKMEGASTSA
ncbi:MAG: hypothetical protein K9H25_13605 [Rhodospirillum sp.]|nr:hypothetical protein [Rhodospirillum sp.]MCF8487797.1 hypothetical protein [Rhodospirillum sp.]MCF8499895.1 hypothetical protein [Rhodospirillum sp.]